MTKWKVRIERVEFIELEVEASSALLARHTMMNRIEDDAEAFGKALAHEQWQDGGTNVESAREVGSEGAGNAERG